MPGPAPSLITRARRRRAAAAAAGLFLLACAVSEPPSGGPEDRTPPAVAFSIPRPDSTGVDPASAIRLGFSEPMTRARVERQVSTAPPIRIRRVSWEDGVLVIEPEGGLARDTTYVVRVRPGYRDAHGVTATAWHEFGFATGAVIDTARIEGVVWLGRQPSPKAIVRAFRVVPGDTVDPLAARPDREATTGADGRYALRYLPSDGARFVVMGFVDQNGNGAYDAQTDPVAVSADTVGLWPGVPVASAVSLNAVDPAEPGSVRGVVINETGIDSALVLVGLFAGEDSTRAQHLAACDSAGAYAIAPVKPGSYTLWAFVDARADSVPGKWPCPGAGAEGCREPRVRLAAPVPVKAGGTFEAPTVIIRRREEP
jgi:hypothetical protein